MSKMKALIIEDDITTAECVKFNFEGHNIQTKIISDPIEGLQKSKSGKYDALIVNLQYPEFLEIDYIKQVRQAGVASVIVILLDKYHKERVIEFLNQGADFFLIQPYDYNELVIRTISILKKYNS